MAPPTSGVSRKRKAEDPSGSTSTSTTNNASARGTSSSEVKKKKSKKMSKDEKAAARERARVAMMGVGGSSGKSNTIKQPPNQSKAAAKVTIASTSSYATVTGKKKKTNEKDSVEMPLPPTSLQRTQSTPLELELQHQVIANVEADMQQKPPPFTKAPPEHLLKFAPTEPEEGYEFTGHEEDNQEDTTGTNSTTSTGTSTAPFLLGLLGLVYLYFYADVMNELFHLFAAQIPLPANVNPYRTPNGQPVPLMPCFLTNVDHPPVHYRPECRNEQLTFHKCPVLGRCWGGNLEACGTASSTSEGYLQVAPNGKQCILKPPVKLVLQHVAQQIQTWTFHHHCQAPPQQQQPDEAIMASPEPQLFKSLDGERQEQVQQPMFIVDHLFDLDPFLLKPIQHLLLRNHNTSPIETLYALLEETNPVSSHKIITEVRTNYVPNIITVYDEELGTDVRREEQIPTYRYYLAIDPFHPQGSWPRKFLSLQRQCQLRLATNSMISTYQSLMEAPWLVLLWLVSMVMMGVWLAVLRHFLDKAKQQQELLQVVEDVREYALTTLKESTPKQWKGSELQNHVKAHCPAMQVTSSQQSFSKRVWPRVVFDLRGNKHVVRSIIVSNADLVDLWAWQPSTSSTSSAAQEEGGRSGGRKGK